MRTIWILMLTVCSSMMMLVTAMDGQIPSFEEFAAKNGKRYVGSSRSVAKANYQENVKKIQALNSQAAANNFNTKFDVNKLSDLSIEELRKTYMGLQVPASKRSFQGRTTRSTTTRTTTTRTTRTTTTRSTTTRTTRTTTTRSTTTRSTTTRTTTTTTTTTTTRNTPTSFDWSAQSNVMPSIKDQMSCGSCWAFAAITLVETYYARKNNSLTLFSEQQLVDCETAGSLGCRGGWPGSALEYVKDKGSMLGSVYGYTALDGTCAYNSGSVITRIGSFDYSPFKDAPSIETDWFNKLATVGPILVCLDADKFHNYRSGILMAANCEIDTINHAVVIVGYGTENGIPYWKIRNSWGTWWGNQGYIQLERGKNACAVTGYEAFYITS